MGSDFRRNDGLMQSSRDRPDRCRAVLPGPTGPTDFRDLFRPAEFLVIIKEGLTDGGNSNSLPSIGFEGLDNARRDSDMTSTAHWTEPSANYALGRRLGRMLPTYTVLYENTRQIVGQSSLQPDILITAPGRAPVAIEAEFMPAYKAEDEAKDRLGLEVKNTARHIDAAIALRYPEGTEDADDLSAVVSNARLTYCVCYQDGTRFPASGCWTDRSKTSRTWLGSCRSHSALLTRQPTPSKRASTAPPPYSVSLRSPGPTSSPASPDCSECPRCSRPTAWPGAIVANAMVFHERLVGLHDVKPLSMLCSTSVANPKGNILEAWTDILKINYWPIFSIARDIVEQLPAAERRSF